MSFTEDLEGLVHAHFAHKPTKCQQEAITEWAEFMLSREADAAFLLRGYAGTGKTSLVAAMVQTLAQLKQPVMLLAPTGRAAKVFSLYSGMPAYTIHRKVYRQKTLTEPGLFQQGVNLHKHTTFIVDEASMVSNAGGDGGVSFGTGRLLDDLIHYVYSCEGCRLMLIGDTAQLPPVGTDESPALDAGMLAGYGLTVWQVQMTEVVRQSTDSGILWNATMLRQMLAEGDGGFGFPRFRIQGMPDIEVVTGDELIDSLESSYSRCGTDDTIVVTRSNKRANIFNQGIRNMVLDREEELESGDMLMIVKNNYYWMEEERKKIKESEERRAKSEESEERRVKSEETAFGGRRESQFNSLANHKVQSKEVQSNELPAFLANGDRAKVMKVSRRIDLYGFHFATLLLKFPDYDNYELEATVLLDTLTSEAPALTHDQQEQLFRQIEEDYQDIPLKADRMKAIRQDPYFNALQVKFAYAVTCHKAQGGQWSHVYVDQGYMTDDMLTPDYIHWLYTAFTRATEMLYLVNWPNTQIEG